MNSEKVPTRNTVNEQVIKITRKETTVSLLKHENIKRSYVADKIISEPTSNPSTGTVDAVEKRDKVGKVNGLTAIRHFANQPIQKDRNQATCSMVVQSGSSLLKLPVKPSNQFQMVSQGKSIGLQIQFTNSLQQKAVENDTKTIASILSAAPSGSSLATVNHANRSLVYREPVSTKDTAPTKNINAKYPNKIIDLTKSGAVKDFNKPHFIGLSNNLNVQHSISRRSKVNKESLLLPCAQFDAKSHNEFVNFTRMHLSQAHNQLLDQQVNKVAENSSNNNHSHDKQLLQQYSERQKLNDSNEQLVSAEESRQMSKIFAGKRSRAKSAYISDAAMIEVRLPTKMSRTKSNESLEIINLDDLPEKCEKQETRVYRTATQHDVLYNMLRLDAEKVIMEQRTLEKKQETKTFTIAGGSKSTVQITNGQLSDINGPIRLLDKSTKPIPTSSVMHIARIQSQNAAIASLPPKDKARKLMESIESKETVLNWLENGDEKQIKRTYSRSKSFSVKSRMHFKIGNLNSQTKMKKVVRKPVKTINHDHDWQTFREALSSNPSKPAINSQQINNENSTGAQSPTDIERILSWNTNKTLGQLPTSQVIFQRNEFDMTEMDVLAMTKIRAMKMHKNDYKNFPQLEPSMACGHPDSAACFDAIMQRLNSNNLNISCKVNEKKPHQYYSTEFKQLVGALVQNKSNNCQAITADDIKGALHETNMYDRTKNSSHFSWSRFIDYYNKKYTNVKRIQLAAPELFANAIPKIPNTFEIGQKLEAIDPQNCSLFCVCTIVDKCGYRIKLRFDGYPATYDFWVNADSINIFPAGWCSKTGRELEVNRRFINNRTMTFEWKEYLRQTNTQAAHQACFPSVNTAIQRTQMNPFKIGMKLEADDIKNTSRICVATIGDVIDSRILVTLDELDSCYNYWTDIRSPYIHPINFHREGGYSINSPPSWRITPFSWDGYLRMNRAESVPRDAFHTREPKAFIKGMALEVVDKKNPSLIRPAVITMIQDYHIKVLFIGWPEKYAYWVDDDSCDIFPSGYCKKTGHPIECPLDDFIYELPKNSCGILGCRGIGNGKRPEATTHSTLEECPYEESNWLALDSDTRPNRVDRKHKTINSAFNIGAGPSRKVSVNPAFEKVQVSLQPTLNPAELAAMSSKDVEIFRRLQVSANFLLENRKALSELRDQWIDRLKPLRSVKVLTAAKNPLNWSKEEVAKFVSQLPNCSTLGSIFIENDIDGLAFLSLRQSDMIDMMGLSMGAAIKVFNRIMLLREECNTHYIRYQ